MDWNEAKKWVVGIVTGGLLGFASLVGVTALSCLAYLGRESYCSGETPLVGFFIVAVSPLAILVGGIIAGKKLQQQSLDEALRREAETLTEGANVPWSPDVAEVPPPPPVHPTPLEREILVERPPAKEIPDVPIETISVNFLDPAACEGFIKGSFADRPERLQHILVVADRVRQTARDINELNPGMNIDETKAYCAALVHDIGYLEPLSVKGFHPVDGYIFLAKSGFRELAALIVGHSSSPEESELLGFGTLRPSTEIIADLITYWDVQVLPGGKVTSYAERAQDILRRYGEETPIGKATIKAQPRIEAILERVRRLLHEIPQ